MSTEPISFTLPSSLSFPLPPLAEHLRSNMWGPKFLLSCTVL